MKTIVWDVGSDLLWSVERCGAVWSGALRGVALTVVMVRVKVCAKTNRGRLLR